MLRAPNDLFLQQGAASPPLASTSSSDTQTWARRGCTSPARRAGALMVDEAPGARAGAEPTAGLQQQPPWRGVHVVGHLALRPEPGQVRVLQQPGFPPAGRPADPSLGVPRAH